MSLEKKYVKGKTEWACFPSDQGVRETMERGFTEGKCHTFFHFFQTLFFFNGGKNLTFKINSYIFKGKKKSGDLF